MSLIKTVAWILMIVGAFINFLVPVALKKKAESVDSVMNKIYVVKSMGLILVIIGCVMIFWLGGKFGV